ncbi:MULTISPECIES: PAS domain S-box protein [Streptomyces]|uniref:PAS domain S-box protein n=1 Tax=Streptomyces TaxID=1883 RepID=UPI000F796046|nr:MULTISPECIES: PAS domain S-box protein [unclassified Streptomyces]NEC77533.1 PAS domain S-box protein [Streptomyces rochei]NUV96275.1 PAS domain S-box protein [Streptomyces sp. KAI 90]RSS14901.1 PAS domain S-box protein [Streptomyces sp. WAC05458]RSS97773.1 PAS domain S-box protein [Streptomyces sp. WAC02707]
MATTSFPDASPSKNKKGAAAPAVPARPGPTGSGTHRGAPSVRACTARVSPGDLTVTVAEPEFARRFGMSTDEIRGRRILDLLHSPVPVRLRKKFTALSTGACRRFTETVTYRDGGGREFMAEVTGVAVRKPSGAVSGFVVSLRRAESAPRAAGIRRAGEKRGTQRGTRPEAADGPVLSALDAQVLEGVASGESTAQLASRLYLSRQGVEYRVGQMFRRFDAPNRPALVARAHALGMFAAGQWPPRVLPDRVR